MGQHEDKIRILEKYSSEMKGNYSFYLADQIPPQLLKNARKSFAAGVDEDTIIGFFDTTLTSNGKQGFLFTDNKVYYLEVLGRAQKIWYDNITKVEIVDENKNDSEKRLKFYREDDKPVIWTALGMNKTPTYEFFCELLEYISKSFDQRTYIIEQKFSEKAFGAQAGGISFGTYRTTNKLYDEENFHANQGHGFAAEKANDLYDKITGHKIVPNAGADNAKDGFDRIVDGIQIQTKYYRTGKDCIDACFGEDGRFRYYNTNTGEPMQIEVPLDKYDAAVHTMEDKIRNGKVEGVSDPKVAKDIVRKGHFTYEQARKIAKSGTVESITYDSVKGAVVAGSAFGITSILTFATSVWGGEDFDVALKNSIYSGVRVGGTAFITSVLSSQLSKAGLNSILVASSENFIAFLGPKASAVLANAFRSGKKIYGIAATKHAAKVLRGNVISSGVSFVVLSTFDVADIVRRRISGKQLVKNLANSAATIGGGSAGWIGGSAIGSMILPGAGAVVGGLIGSIAAGSVAGKSTNHLMGKVIKDDADKMVRIIQEVFEDLASDYLLNRKEAEKIIDKMSHSLNGKKLKDMFASKHRREFARRMLIPIIEKEIKHRKYIKLPSDEQMIAGLRKVLEECADCPQYDSI